MSTSDTSRAVGSHGVLFVCQFNSARSQLAEALARRAAPVEVRVMSAGLMSSVVNAEVLRALSEIGIDASRQASKSLTDVPVDAVHEVIALCEEARLPSLRRFPDAVHHLWPMEDPIAVQDAALVPARVRGARDHLGLRVESWLRDRGR